MVESYFFRDNNNYLTIPVLRKFCKENDIIVRGSYREDFLTAIDDFSQKEGSKEAINKFAKIALKQGIKTLYINKVYGDVFNELKKQEKCEEYLKQKFPNCPQDNLFDCKTTSDFKLQNYEIICDGNLVKMISFCYTKYLLKKTKDNTENGDRIIFPVFIDLDIENGYIIYRFKSMQDAFFEPIDDNTMLIVETRKINLENLAKDVKKVLLDKLGIVELPKEQQISIFKRKLFNVLHNFTFTPQEIQNKVDRYKNSIDKFILDFFKSFNIDVNLNKVEAEKDLSIFIEKYISINYANQEIFVADREAYPIKLCATDHEFTKVEETSGGREPLQCKEKFFDNKKSIEIEQACEKITLCYKRINPSGFFSERFIVSLIIEKGTLVIKFFEYVEEEDINNVLSRIIESN